MLPNTKMATETEVDGDFTVSVPQEFEEKLENELASQKESESQTDTETEEVESKEPEKEPEKVSEPEPVRKTEPPRQERRMEKLIDKLKERTDQVSELRKQLETVKTPQSIEEQQQPVTGQGLPPWMQPSQAAPEEISPEQYKQDVVSTAHGLVKSEIAAYRQQVEKYENFKDDLSYVETNYPILNPDSDSYDGEKSKTISELYQKASQADEKLRLKDFVNSIMSFHQAGQEIGQKEVTQKSIQREAEAAVTPSNANPKSSQSEVDWDSMSLKEKEQWMKDNGVWDY